MTSSVEKWAHPKYSMIKSDPVAAFYVVFLKIGVLLNWQNIKQSPQKAGQNEINKILE